MFFSYTFFIRIVFKWSERSKIAEKLEFVIELFRLIIYHTELFEKDGTFLMVMLSSSFLAATIKLRCYNLSMRI